MKNSRTDKDSLKIVHDEELSSFLGKLEMLSDIKLGKVKCKFCRDIISLENINGIFPEENLIQISCDKPECILSLSIYLNDHNV